MAIWKKEITGFKNRWEVSKIETIVTQEKLIHEIAKSEDMNVATVRQVLKSAENILTNYLSSTTPTDSYIIKLFNGLSIESRYVPKRNINKGMFQNYKCNDKIKINSNITKYYKQKINHLHT